MMQQSSRRPPSYPPPTRLPPAPVPRAPSQQAATMAAPGAVRASSSASPPPPAPSTYTNSAKRDVVVRPLALKLLAIVGILHASVVLMALVILFVMALGGDARVALIIRTIKASGM